MPVKAKGKISGVKKTLSFLDKMPMEKPLTNPALSHVLSLPPMPRTKSLLLDCARRRKAFSFRRRWLAEGKTDEVSF